MGEMFTFDDGYAKGGHGAVWMQENLSLWPLFKMRSTGGRPGPDEIETHTVELYSIDAGGSKVEGKLTLRGSAGVGLPRYWDQDALFAVEELLHGKGGPDKDGGMNFSQRELALLARLEPSKEYYDRMRASLDRIGSMWIISDKAFYNPRTESLISDRFNLWTVKFREDRDLYSRHLKEQNRLQFHKNFIDAYEGGHGRYLDRDFYWGLHYPTSKRLYRLLSSQFAYQKEWRVDPFTLRDLMLIGGYRHVSRIRQVMTNAHEELISRGFLRSVEDTKTGNGKKVLVYKSSKRYATRMRERRVLDETESRVAYELLKEHGVWRSARLSLIEEHGAERCITASEALVRKRGVRDEGAWLQRAIEEGYEFPELESEHVGGSSGDKGGVGEEDPVSRAPRVAKKLGGKDSGGVGVSGVSEDTGFLAKGSDGGRGGEAVAHLAHPGSQEVWEGVLRRAEHEFSGASLGVWFKEVIPVGCGEDWLIISVPNNTAAQYIKSRFSGLLEKALAHVLDVDKASVSIRCYGEK